MKLVNPESYDALADIGLIPGVMGNQEFYVELQETLKAMKKLPVGMQSALALVGAQQYQYNEVANLTSVSLGTVKSRVARGRHRLRVALGTCEPVWQAYR
jgi:DNA-directed RNA polymerase specialized sigma24 family protein